MAQQSGSDVVSEDVFFTRFITGFGNHTTLSANEEAALIVAAKGGDSKALNRLVRHNIRTIFMFMRRYKRRAAKMFVTEGELFSLVGMGLHKAVMRFEPERGVRLSTYADHWIRHTVLHYLANHGLFIRRANEVVLCRARINRFTNAFVSRNGRQPTDEEIAEQFQMELPRLKVMLDAPGQPLSLDMPMGRSGHEKTRLLLDTVSSGGTGILPGQADATLGELVADDSAGECSAEETVYRKQVAALLAKAKAVALDPRERFVLECRYGKAEMTRDQTAAALQQQLGTLPECGRVDHIQKSAVDKMRQYLRFHMR